VICMYRIGKQYKIELKKPGIFYTGEILEEDSVAIRLKTRRNEEQIVNKDEILQAKLIGDTDEQSP
jgi:hypothetical protein